MNALIIEDEILLAKELKYKISQIDPSLEILEIIGSLRSARKWFSQNNAPDLLFMDIQLGDGISFELFEDFNPGCPVIFTTAFEEYAIRAFKANGIDYLLKPIDDGELSEAIQKARLMISRKAVPERDWQQFVTEMNKTALKTNFKEKILVNFRNAWIPINTADIACFFRDNLNYLITFSGEKYNLETESLDELESVLDPLLFFRANRQFIVNINAIQKVVPHENHKLSLHLTNLPKIEVDISREKAPAFRKWLDR